MTSRGIVPATLLSSALLLPFSAAAWIRTIDGAGSESSSTEAANRAVIGADGDIYIAGILEDLSSPGCQRPAFLVARLSRGTGVQKWTTTLHGSANPLLFCGELAQANALAIDQQGGNVVAAGALLNLPPDGDFSVVKLSQQDGSVLWRESSDAGSSRGVAYAVAVDQHGDVFAAGQVGLSSSQSSFYVQKLAGSDGHLLWERIVGSNVSVEGADGGAFDLRVDASGDVVAAGFLDGFPVNASLDNSTFSVLKLSGNDGTQLWRYNHTRSEGCPCREQARAIALTSTGNVVAVGSAFPALMNGGQGLVVEIAGTSGSLVWASELDLDQHSVDVDSSGDVISGGVLRVPGTSQGQFGVTKLRGSDGSPLWRMTAGSEFDDSRATSVATFVDLDVLAVGYVRSQVGPRALATFRLASDSGAVRWSRFISGSDPVYGRSFGWYGVVDDLGNAAAVGSIGNTSSDLDVVAAKLDGSTGDDYQDSDDDGVADEADNCPAIENSFQDDADGDLVGDVCDNCSGVPNVGQQDYDSDLAGDACDNCVAVANPRVAPGWLSSNAWAVLTGGQRDDDFDGFGNKCDGKFPGSFGSGVNAGDTALYKASIGRDRRKATCGTPAGFGTLPCAIFDLDEGTTNGISAADTARYKLLIGSPPGPKCPACPLTCEAGALRSCEP